MKHVAALLLLLVGGLCFLQGAEQLVRGYTKKDGTYVAPYYRTTPNNTTRDNYGTAPNVNPHTGRAGTKRAKD